MNNKTMWVGVVVAIVFAGGGFYGGMQYQAGQASAARTAGAGGFTGGAGGGARGAGRFGAGGNAAFGTIIAADATSITVQLSTATSSGSTNTGTGSKIVLFDANTQIMKTVAGTAKDLSVGQNVTASGTTNADGSITATSIQLRPAPTSRPTTTTPAGQ